MTAKQLEKLWQEWNIENEHELSSLNEFLSNYGEAWLLDDFLCNGLPEDLNNYYYVRNASNTEYYYEIVAGRKSPKGYYVTFEMIDLKARTTDEIISEFINRNEVKEL